MKKDINTNLNTNTELLKLIALISMLIDHIGAILFPHLLILRIIGRISYPLFAYSTFIGYFKTHNLKKYILRILVLACISQPIYILAFNYPIFRLNIFFTLALELIILYLIDNKKWWLLSIPVLSVFLINYEYGLLSLFLIIIFYCTKKSDFIFTISFITLFTSYAVSNKIVNGYPICTEFFAILAIPLIIIKTNIKININKWFYYIFYPAHLFVLFILNNMTILLK